MFYVDIHEKYCLFELPWNSTWTWILAMLGVDLGYYWVHRCAHGLYWFVVELGNWDTIGRVCLFFLIAIFFWGYFLLVLKSVFNWIPMRTRNMKFCNCQIQASVHRIWIWISGGRQWNSRILWIPHLRIQSDPVEDLAN